MKYYIIPHSPLSTDLVNEFSVGKWENLKLLFNQGLKKKATGQQTANRSVLASAFAQQVVNINTCQTKWGAWVRESGDVEPYLTQLFMLPNLFRTLDVSDVFRFIIQGWFMKKMKGL